MLQLQAAWVNRVITSVWSTSDLSVEEVWCDGVNQRQSHASLSDTETETLSSVCLSAVFYLCASLTHACLSGLFLSLHLQLDWAIIFVNTPPHCISCAHSWCLSDLFKCFLESQSVAVSHLWLDFTENIVTALSKLQSVCLSIFSEQNINQKHRCWSRELHL